MPFDFAHVHVHVRVYVCVGVFVFVEGWVVAVTSPLLLTTFSFCGGTEVRVRA